MGNFVNGNASTPGTATADSTITLPAGLVAGQRAYALISSGATNPTTFTAQPAGWIKLDQYSPSGVGSSALWYIDITSANASSLSGAAQTWTWSASSRTTAAWLLYGDVDQTRAPAFARTAAPADSSAAITVPGVSVPAGDWELVMVAGRQSPGTDGAKSWSSAGATSDAERYDVYATNTGTGQKLTVAGYDTAGPADQSTTGGGGTVVNLNGARPANAYNALALTSAVRIGATIDKTAISYWEPKLVKNGWMRIFPNSDKLPPDWTDARFQYCQRVGAHPFISTKVDGDTTKLQTLYDYLAAMPAWLRDDPAFLLWYTEHHEPEKENATSPATFINNYRAVWNKLATLPTAIRNKIRMGPALTKQWTESPSKGNYNYQTFDPGAAYRQFKGYDVYADSSSGGAAITSYPDPAPFLQYIKADNANSQPKIFVELGVIGAPFDTDGSARAAWLRGIHDEALSWGDFGGLIWWCDDGTSSSTAVTGIGTARYFQLDRRHTGTDNSYAILPSVAATVTVGGGGGSARTVTPNVTLASAHVWAASVPMGPAAPTSAPNPWTAAGVLPMF